MTRRRTTTENFSLDSNTLRLGYAAASTSNIQTEGELTNAVYEKIVHRYVETLCRYVTNFGFTPKELFTHIGGNYAPFDKHLKFWPAINRYATLDGVFILWIHLLPGHYLTS